MLIPADEGIVKGISGKGISKGITSDTFNDSKGSKKQI